MLDLTSSLVWFAIVTAGSTYLLAMAYRNTKFQLKHKVAVKREDAVVREMSKKLAEDKKMSKKEKDERFDIHLLLKYFIIGYMNQIYYDIKDGYLFFPNRWNPKNIKEINCPKDSNYHFLQ